ncbi:SAC domain-containing protein [Trichophyton interdigitale]|uniref:phosphoinositide 5-phosphatase n=1 Tax=Trichophyton interdigitale TaxID=101480 RepID=A0A9P4YLA9_9EURO|nr:SAC domain-containing protein [Trichophyton interdigitale]KAF3900729.1 SAC domain-containing protein [Trichophyton interdigitale]KAG8211587.1 SAC domain-containing protein [Trichophyton interdigitale]
MAVRVLCKDAPDRTVVLVANGYALTMRHHQSSEEVSGNVQVLSIPKCIVEFTTADSIPLAEYRTLGTGLGTLGLIALAAGEVFICIVNQATNVASVRPGETVQRIDSVDFYCLNRSDYDLVQNLDSDTYNNPSGRGYQGYESPAENPSLALKKLLSDGSFYYSSDFNLTERIQDRIDDPVAYDVESQDEDFLWNSFMIKPLLQLRSGLSLNDRQNLDSSQLLISVIRGFAQSLTIPASSPLFPHIESNMPSSLTVISRLSSRRAGTRFNARGIDDNGNVANFVETETILWIPPAMCFSYTQIRGSVPIFWEQEAGYIPGQQKIAIGRSSGATQPAFDKHFEALAEKYGAVHAINLLAKAKSGEVELSQRYMYHVRASPLRQNRDVNSNSEHDILKLTEYDFHAETKTTGYEAARSIQDVIADSVEGFAYFLSEAPQGNEKDLSAAELRLLRQKNIVLQQEGVFRTNCLDCLDRTNLVQTMISSMAIDMFFAQWNGHASPDFWMKHSTLWADSGDMLSRIYAGTGALKSSFTRHGAMSVAGSFADIRKSATRLFVNNFTDPAKQITIDTLLGLSNNQESVYLFDPVKDAVNAELTRRVNEFTSSEKIYIWVGTFNINGRREGATEGLGPWLHGSLNQLPEDPTIVAVGFQEIVELSPQQIMSTDPSTRKIWEHAVISSLNARTTKRGTTEYVLLRSGQLVGAALLLFVKKDVINKIKNAEGSLKKTGLSGMGGNKGAVAIRLDYSNTSICFITAHLAAGFSNYEERNRDYHTIARGLRFQRNRPIVGHDATIWFGDFNYRIGLSNERVRPLIESGDIDVLYQHDQLNLQMVAGLAFQYYMEGPVTFPPTYRYDNGTDEYDTSEKQRIPAWCDRILWRGRILRQLAYTTAPLKFSDHRPVYATFECDISTVDEKRKEEISCRLYEKLKQQPATTTTNPLSDDEEDDNEQYSIKLGLPPPSSEKRKWWLDHGLPARSTITPPLGAVSNVRRSANPFSFSRGSDWITVGRDDALSEMSEQDLRESKKASSTYREPFRSVGEVMGGPESSATDMPQTSKVVVSSRTVKSVKIPPPVPRKPAKLRRHSSGGTDRKTASSNGVSSGYEMVNPAEDFQEQAYTGGAGAATTSSVSQATKSLPTNELMDSDAGTRVTSWEPLQPKK